jgi:hypothetical protein
MKDTDVLPISQNAMKKRIGGNRMNKFIIYLLLIMGIITYAAADNIRRGQDQTGSSFPNSIGV